MPPLTSLRTGHACKYCKRPTKLVTPTSSPPGTTPINQLFNVKQLSKPWVVCDYCDRYSEQPHHPELEEAA